MHFIKRWRALAMGGMLVFQAGVDAAVPSFSLSNWPGYHSSAKWGRPQWVVVGYPFSYPATASFSPSSYEATGLPPGLTIDRTHGVISGRPQVAGQFVITLRATNADGTGTANATLNVEPAPTAPPVVTPPATIDTMYQGYVGNTNWADITGFLINVTNAPTSYGVTALPPGVHLNPDNVGVVSWSVNGLTPGVYISTLSATNAIGTGSATLRWVIHPRLQRASADVASMSPVYAGATVTVIARFDAPVVVTGTPSVALRSLNYRTGRGPAMRATYGSGSGTDTLHFTYRTTIADVHYDVTEVADRIDLDGAAINHLSTGISAHPIAAPQRLINPYTFGAILLPAPTITSAASASGEVGRSFSLTLTAANSPRLFRILSGPLPPGLSLASTTGVISGTPTQSGTFPLTIEAVNNPEGFPSQPAPAQLTITISPASTSSPPPAPPPQSPPPPAAPPPPAPTASPIAQTIALHAPASVTVGQPATITATASSGLPVTLSVASGSATLSGAQLTAHTAGGIVLRVAQSGSSVFAPATAEFTFSALRAAQALDFVSPVSTIVIGQPIQLSATASSGLPVVYSIVSGNATLSGSAVTVIGPGPVVIRASQPGSDAFEPVSSMITLTGAVRAAQSVAIAPSTTELQSDRTLALTATATSGLPVTFEVVSGPATLRGNLLVPTAAAGTVTLRAIQQGNDAFDRAEATRTVSIRAASRLVNLSSRVTLGDSDANRSLIAGFVVAGPASKRMLVRAVGPALANFGVQAALANPRLRVFDSAGRLLTENDNWSGADLSAASARVGAFALATGSLDAAMLVSLPPGAYSLHVEGSGPGGVALAEIYDASDVPALEPQQVVNISTRAFVGTGEGVLTAGFVVTGSVPKRLLIRGVGSGLAAYGVTGVLADPVLHVYQGTAMIAQNDDWQTPQSGSAAHTAAIAGEIAAAATRAGAFSLGNGAKDAALLITLAPGAYTAMVSGAGNSMGNGLVEVYEVSVAEP